MKNEWNWRLDGDLKCKYLNPYIVNASVPLTDYDNNQFYMMEIYGSLFRIFLVKLENNQVSELVNLTTNFVGSIFDCPQQNTPGSIIEEPEPQSRPTFTPESTKAEPHTTRSADKSTESSVGTEGTGTPDKTDGKGKGTQKPSKPFPWIWIIVCIIILIVALIIAVAICLMMSGKSPEEDNVQLIGVKPTNPDETAAPLPPPEKSDGDSKRSELDVSSGQNKEPIEEANTERSTDEPNGRSNGPQPSLEPMPNKEDEMTRL